MGLFDKITIKINLVSVVKFVRWMKKMRLKLLSDKIDNV